MKFFMVQANFEAEVSVQADNPYILFRPRGLSKILRLAKRIKFWICDPGTFSNQTGKLENLLSFQDYIDFLGTQLPTLAEQVPGVALSFDIIPNSQEEAQESWRHNVANYERLVQLQRTGKIPFELQLVPVIHFQEPIKPVIQAVHEIVDGRPLIWAIGGLVGRGASKSGEQEVLQYISQVFDTLYHLYRNPPRIHLLGQIKMSRLVVRPFMSFDISFRGATYLSSDRRYNPRYLSAAIQHRSSLGGKMASYKAGALRTIQAFMEQARRATAYHLIKFGYAVDPGTESCDISL